MSHITCHKCGSNEHMTGYGLAYGPIGSYTACECGELLEFMADLEGLDDDEARTIQANVDDWRKTTAPDNQESK